MSLLCLHIGLPKTGSSAIQGFLRDYVDALSELGVHYALNSETEADSAGAPNGNGRALLKYLDSRRRRPGFSLEAFEERQFEEFYISESHRMSLISSELLAGVEKRQLARFGERIVRDRPIMVVGVVRNLYDHAFSSWNQLVKRHAYAGSFEHYVREDYRNPQTGSLRTYAKYFGWSQLRVVLYDSSPRDIVTPFLQTIGVSGGPDWKAPRVNRSLSRAELSVQRALNRIHGDPALATQAAERFLASRPQAKSARIWKPKLARLLAERFGDEVREVGARVGVDLEGLVEMHPCANSWISPLEFVDVVKDALPVLRRGLEARRSAGEGEGRESPRPA